MGMKRTSIHVVDMSCSSCEARIKKTLESLEGVVSAQVSIVGGRAEVEYDDSEVSVGAMIAAVEKAGYTVGANATVTGAAGYDTASGGGRGAAGNSVSGTAIALGIGLILVALYMVASATGLFSAIPTINASLGYGMLFVVGLLTSVHCVAMCGGIALSQSLARLGEGDEGAAPSKEGCTEGATWFREGCAEGAAPSRQGCTEGAAWSRAGGAENAAPYKEGCAEGAAPGAGKFKRLMPGLLYNGGRVVAYTVVGGLVGALGAALSFSSLMKGVIAAAAGFFMVLFGLKMLGILSVLPRITRLVPAPLRSAAGRFSSALGRRGPFAVGLLNGLMPCGPLQTMQLYALGTGSFFAGALSMFIFSVGTVPLMLVFGFAAAFIPKKLVPMMIKASAVLVMFLGLITLGRAAALSGIALPSKQASYWTGERKAGGLARAEVRDGVQTVLTDFGSSGYYLPFAVQAGIPVKWTIRVKADGLNGCNNPITIPSYGIKKTLVPGDNLIEFTPENPGTITYTCWMGMISSRITVVK